MQFGKKTEVKDMGHDITQITETTYNDSVPREVVTYEQRIKVTDRQEELAEYIKFRQQTEQDDNVAFRFQRNEKGNQYIIKVWQDKR